MNHTVGFMWNHVVWMLKVRLGLLALEAYWAPPALDEELDVRDARDVRDVLKEQERRGKRGRRSGSGRRAGPHPRRARATITAIPSNTNDQESPSLSPRSFPPRGATTTKRRFSGIRRLLFGSVPDAWCICQVI